MCPLGCSGCAAAPRRSRRSPMGTVGLVGELQAGKSSRNKRVSLSGSCRPARPMKNVNRFARQQRASCRLPRRALVQLGGHGGGLLAPLQVRHDPSMLVLGGSPTPQRGHAGPGALSKLPCSSCSRGGPAAGPHHGRWAKTPRFLWRGAANLRQTRAVGWPRMHTCGARAATGRTVR